MSETSKPADGFHRFLSELGPGALLSAAAILAAFYISEKPRFERIGAVVSDEISRALGVYSNGPLVLVRLDREFPKADLQRLLARAIPALMDNYQAAALGVDIDFSGRDYNQLAKDFSDWSRRRPGPAGKIVWAVGYERGHERAATEQGEIEVCANCDASCVHRFRPKPVFGNEFDPSNYGLAYAWTDTNGISRSSFRFGCHQDTLGRLRTFHFKLVEAYCGGNTQDDKCATLKPYHQSATKLFSWFDAKVYDLCLLVQCSGADLGAAPEKPPNYLANKIPILYSDVEGDDEHATSSGHGKEQRSSLL